MNKAKWLRRLEELSKVKNSYQFEIGDCVNVGIQAFGRTEAFDAAQQITGTGNTRNFYTRCSAVAQLYPAALRFATLSFSVYEALRHFPMSFLETFIAEVAPSGRSCKQILHLAIEQFGSNPSPHKKRRKRKSVNLKMSVYLAACERAKAEKTQVQYWIEQVLTDYMGAEAVGTQKDEGPDTESDGNEVPSAQPQPTASAEPETPRPDYATRRAQQLGAGAEPIALKKRKRYSLRVQWTECHGEAFTDTENGPVPFRAPSSGKPTKFLSEEDAIRAEEEHFKESGYHERVVLCPSCSLQASSSRGKKQVWHVKHQFSGILALLRRALVQTEGGVPLGGVPRGD